MEHGIMPRRKKEPERPPLYTRIFNDLIDQNLPPVLHMTLERLHRWADRGTGRVKMCSGRLLETITNHQWGYEAYKDALNVLEEAGYIVREMKRGSHSSYPVLISNYWGVKDGKPIGKINARKVHPPDEILARQVPRKSRAKSSASANASASSGVTPPEATPEAPPEAAHEVALKSSRSSRSSLNSGKVVESEEQKLQDVQAAAAQPSPAASSILKPITATAGKAERLARRWWVIQGGRKDQVDSVKSWSHQFEGLLRIYPDLEECLYFLWNCDKFWGKNNKAQPMLRYGGGGDSVETFLVPRLLLPDYDPKSLWHNFARFRSRMETKGKALGTFPADLPALPEPSVPASAKSPRPAPRPTPARPRQREGFAPDDRVEEPQSHEAPPPPLTPNWDDEDSVAERRRKEKEWEEAEEMELAEMMRRDYAAKMKWPKK
jgi:hypothetical protein